MDSQSGDKPASSKPARNYQVPYHVFASTTAEASRKDRSSRPRPRKYNYKIPENLDHGTKDPYGMIIHLTGDKKKAVEAAVFMVCRDLEKTVPEDFIPEEWKEKFYTLLKQHVRGIMYTLMAPQPLMNPAKYVQLYQITNKPSKNAAFMQSMKDRLINLIKNAPKTPHEPTSEDEPEYDGESIEKVQNDPKFLDWIQQAGGNNSWYMDYVLDKVFTKAVKTVRSENCIEDITENIPSQDTPMEVKLEKDESAITTENVKGNEKNTSEINTTTELVPAKSNDMSNITLPELLEKINQSDDMESIARFVDLRLARMANKIKDALVLAATRGPGFVIVHPRMKQLGLDGMQLKTRRKLHYATVVTHQTVSSELLKKYSIAASWQSKPFKKLKYAQTYVAVLARGPYRHLLGRHLTHFEGYKMAVTRSFPPDQQDLEDEREEERKKEEALKAAMETEDNEELPPELY